MNLHVKAVRDYPVVGLCRLFGVTKQAYYKYDENAVLVKVAQEAFVLQYIHEIRKKDPGIGGMKLWHMYRKTFGCNHPVGRDRFEDIVDRYGLKVRARVRKPGTTDSTHSLPVYPNIIKDFIPDAPNQLWVSDITYITVWLDEYNYVFCYLSLILDAYTEEIIGWSVGPTLEATYPMEALRKALKRIAGKEDLHLIHHSDRGCQYASKEYVSVLKRHGIRISMTESGDPKENAQAERINGTMKNELLKDIVFRSIKEVKAAVSVVVDFYNNERPHMSIDMMTPSEAAYYSGEIKKRWTRYRHIAIKSRPEGLDIAGNGLPLADCQGAPSGLRPPVNS
ncbi:MAG: IS3 family transposase [Tannerellaceae bacterium]|jgi:transposase InsO family protein|nr:IS3 family transposase [Tannerellaceae bacterium]